MWKNLKSFFEADATLELDASGNQSTDTMIVAVLAITLEAAYADGNIGNFEIDRAVEVIANEFQKDDSYVRQQIEIAEFMARDTTKLSVLTDNIRDNLNESQKIEVLKAVWKVIKADSKIEKSEATFAAELRKLLGLTMEQALFAQKG